MSIEGAPQPGSTVSLSPSASEQGAETTPTGKHGYKDVTPLAGKQIISQSQSSDSLPGNKPLGQMTVAPVAVKNQLPAPKNRKRAAPAPDNENKENAPPLAKRTKTARKRRLKTAKRSHRPETAQTPNHQKARAKKRSSNHLSIDDKTMPSSKQQKTEHNTLTTPNNTSAGIEQPTLPKEKFAVWNQALKSMKQQPQKAVNYLFGGPYRAETADMQFQEMLKDKTSNLSLLMERMESTWEQTATPEHKDTLRSNMEAKLKFAWQRMSKGDTYKLQMLAEALCLQPGGGHHQSPELKQFIQHMDKTITDFRDGRIYDGTNAIDANTPQGGVTRSQKKVVAVESTYNGANGNETEAELENVDKEPGTIRNTNNIPDISLSNLGKDSKVHVELDIQSANGGSLKDSIAFSDGTYSFHGASVEMEVRDDKIGTQLQSGEFARRIDAYATHNLEKGRPHEDLAITGDANLCLFDDAPPGTRTLKPGVQEILDKHHLALVVPSGKVTWGRPISDQLHKNATSTELDGYRDTMLLMVPVTEGNIEAIRELGEDPALRQDTFFPTTMVGGKATETSPIIHRIESDRKQFSLNFNDRMITDHAILTGPNHIVGNTADCKGIGTPGKSLTYDGAKTVWGNDVPTLEQYHQMMLDTAEELANIFSFIEQGIPLSQANRAASEE